MKLAVVLTFCILQSAVPIVYAAKPPEPPISIPERQGTVTDYYPGPELPAKQVIVMIQDLHANVGVQKNIASILYRLLRHNKVPTLVVCVEGASGEGDVSLLRSLPRFIRHAFEAMLLHKAYLTGGELAATEAAAQWEQQQVVLWDRIKSWFLPRRQVGPVTLSPILLWGVDDPELYRKNWRAAKFVDKNHHGPLKDIKGIRNSTGDSSALKKQQDLIVKLMLLRLQPREYKEYLKGRSLNPRGSKMYDDVIKAGETYYEAAEARSDAMVKNLIARMGKTPGYTALISGGFHTQEMAEAFKARKIAYMVVTPQVRVLDQDEAYRARLREEE